LDLIGVEHREQHHVAARDLIERRRDAAGLREGRDLRGIDVVTLRIEARADQPVCECTAEQAEADNADLARGGHAAAVSPRIFISMSGAVMCGLWLASIS